MSHNPAATNVLTTSAVLASTSQMRFVLNKSATDARTRVTPKRFSVAIASQAVWVGNLTISDRPGRNVC